MVSIHDVARAAGCSIATVSCSLNNTGRVRPETRARVLEVCRRMGYTPNAKGRQLRLQRTETIGLLFYPSCARLFRNVFYTEIMEGFEEALIAHRQHLLLGSFELQAGAGASPAFISQGRVDGLVVLGGMPKSAIDLLAGLGVPLLLLDTDADHLKADSVTSDGQAAGVAVVDLLVARGHRRIVMLDYEREDFNAAQRAAGFRAGLKKHRLPVADALLVAADVDLLYPMLRKRLRGDQPPTAVFAVNDTLARWIVERLEADGLRVPQDVSIVGFNDDDHSRDREPQLTTVAVDKHALGRLGVETILARIADGAAPPVKTRTAIRIVERASVRALA